VLDTDESHTLTFHELAAGLKKLRVKPQVHISEDDWDVMTVNGSLLNSSGELGEAEFEMVMRRQVIAPCLRDGGGTSRCLRNSSPWRPSHSPLNRKCYNGSILPAN